MMRMTMTVHTDGNGLVSHVEWQAEQARIFLPGLEQRQESDAANVRTLEGVCSTRSIALSRTLRLDTQLR